MIIEIEQGCLKGVKSTSILSGNSYYSFLGIPYAEPPIGELRFQAPEPHKGWKGVFEAKEEGSQCLQKDGFSKTIEGDENCLFLNVYVPDINELEPKNKNELKPVMVYLHGGAHSVGSGTKNLYSPDYLINYDVILVTINYRLHVLGFLNLGLPECAGNMGLKDQTLALKWIKKNIKSFGGDNENITLFGESSGASSVNYHMISPLSKGLFNKCIMQSGSALASWAFADNLEIMEATLEVLGTQLGYCYRNKYDFLLFLKTVTGEKLAAAADVVADKILEMYPTLTYPMCFLPSLEKVKEGAFLPDTPKVLLMNSISVPIMAGVTDSEADMLFPDYAPIRLAYDAINHSFETVIKYNAPDIKLSGVEFKEKCEQIKKYYFGDRKANEETYEETLDLHSDMAFIRPLYKSIEKVLHSNQSVYIYNFTFTGSVRFCDIYKSNKKLTKATHCDELPYLFYGTLYNISDDFLHKEPECSVIRNICTLWTNFAKNGDPNGGDIDVKWKPTSIGSHQYLEIDHKLSLKQGRIKEDRLSIWEEFTKNI